MMRASRTLILAGLFTIVLTIGWLSPTYADMGFPMIVVVLPASWVLLIPVIIVEAVIDQRLLVVGWRRALWVSSAANALSTLVGIPVVWGALFLVEMLFSLVPTPSNGPHIVGIFGFAFGAPWLGSEPHYWEVTAAAMALCIPFLFASVWVERWVTRRMLPQAPNKDITRCVWIGNLLSYGILELVLLTVLVYSLRISTPAFQ